MISRFIDIERLIHSIKTVIACLIGVLLTKLIGIPADQWVIITIIVVMCAQIYVGSVLQKAYLRFLGTLLGCLFAMIMLVLIGDNGMAIAITIAISSFVFSYLATGQESLSYTGTLGAVTTAIIMLGQTPTITFAIERFLEITLGIFIATIVSQFVLPIHARKHLRRAQAATLEQLREYFTATIATSSNKQASVDLHDFDEEVVRTISKQRQLAKESQSEPLGTPFNPELFGQSLYFEREMLRAISFMNQALAHISETNPDFVSQPALILFSDQVIQTFNHLAKSAWSEKPIEDTTHLANAAELNNIRSQVTIDSKEKLSYLDGFLFSAEILADNLAKLTHLYNSTFATNLPRIL